MAWSMMVKNLSVTLWRVTSKHQVHAPHVVDDLGLDFRCGTPGNAVGERAWARAVLRAGEFVPPCAACKETRSVEP